jgi:hypothetical protein
VVSDEVDLYHPACAEGCGCGGAGVLVGVEESVCVVREGVYMGCER